MISCTTSVLNVLPARSLVTQNYVVGDPFEIPHEQKILQMKVQQTMSLAKTATVESEIFATHSIVNVDLRILNFRFQKLYGNIR